MQKKLFGLSILGRNNSGIILILVLWILVILTTLALTLGRRTFVDTSLTSHLKGRLRAKYFAWAGLNYARDLIRQDTKDEVSSKYDTLSLCGVPISTGKSAQELFHEVSLQEGTFTIDWGEASGYQESVSLDSESSLRRYGFCDEERYLNINAISSRNVPVFIHLIDSLIDDKDTASTIAYSLLDWQDKDDNTSHKSYGAEKDYYEDLETSYFCKNAPFDSLEEMMLVRGVTPEIYAVIKNYLTIYPLKGGLKVNFNTASGAVLKAIGQMVIGERNQNDASSLDSLVDKLIAYRTGEDGVPFTQDDQEIEYRNLSLNSAEKNLFLRMNQYRVNRSSYFRVHVTGTDVHQKISSSIEAVIRRNDLSIVFWKREL